MERRIGEVTLNAVTLKYVEHGEGMPLLALHGVGVDHRELEGALEALDVWGGIRRIYLDLPGMGHSTAEGVSSNNEVVELLAAFLRELDAGPALVLGHSYGAYLARGLAARHPDAVAGLALICPIGDDSAPVPKQEVVQQDADAYDELDPELREGFDDYFVVRTAATARRYRDRTVPGMSLVDPQAIERLSADWRLDLSGPSFVGPTLIVAGRHDSTAGYRSAAGLIARYPAATLAVFDDAGHALPHERPERLAQLLSEWLAQR